MDAGNAVPSVARGIEIRLTVDETTFVGNSVAIFSRVIDRMFTPYAYTNSFVELVILSKATGSEIERCAPREGTSQLL
jgi:type VI secretion system protein ImpG